MSRASSKPLHVILGSGATARATLDQLITLHPNQYTIRLVNTSGHLSNPSQHIPPTSYEVVKADLYNADDVARVTAGATCVYQCAQPRYSEWQDKFPKMQRAIIEGMVKGNPSSNENNAQGKPKLVLVENTYMYGPTHGQVMTEDTEHKATTKKGKIRSEMSKEAFKAHEEGKIIVTAARGSDFFGPHALGSAFGERMFYPLVENQPANATGNIKVPHTVTYVKDFGKVLVALGESDLANGQVWHVPNDQPQISQEEFIKIVGEALGVPDPKINSMGKWMMWIGGFFIPEAKEMVEMMYEFDEPFVIDSGKFEQTFQIKATPLRDAVKETVEWYKANPRAK